MRNNRNSVTEKKGISRSILGEVELQFSGNNYSRRTEMKIISLLGRSDWNMSSLI